MTAAFPVGVPVALGSVMMAIRTWEQVSEAMGRSMASAEMVRIVSHYERMRQDQVLRIEDVVEICNGDGYQWVTVVLHRFDTDGDADTAWRPTTVLVTIEGRTSVFRYEDYKSETPGWTGWPAKHTLCDENGFNLFDLRGERRMVS